MSGKKSEKKKSFDDKEKKEKKRKEKRHLTFLNILSKFQQALFHVSQNF